MNCVYISRTHRHTHKEFVDSPLLQCLEIVCVCACVCNIIRDIKYLLTSLLQCVCFTPNKHSIMENLNDAVYVEII